MTTFLLVPGFWLGGWAWDRVAEPLRTAGHDVHVVSLAGMDDPAATGIDLARHITDVTELIERLPVPVTLVGHSYAGMVVTGAADRRPDRVARLVYVDTGPVPPGTAQVDTGDPADRQYRLDAIAEHGPDWRIPVPAFDNAELSEADLALLRERAVPQPVGTTMQPMPAASPARRELPTDVISCTFPADAMEQMLAAGHPMTAELATHTDRRVHGLPTGHWPMFSRPYDLAKLLDSLA